MSNRIIYIFLAALVVGVGIAGWQYMATRGTAPPASSSDGVSGTGQQTQS